MRGQFPFSAAERARNQVGVRKPILFMRSLQIIERSFGCERHRLGFRISDGKPGRSFIRVQADCGLTLKSEKRAESTFPISASMSSSERKPLIRITRLGSSAANSSIGLANSLVEFGRLLLHPIGRPRLFHSCFHGLFVDIENEGQIGNAIAHRDAIKSATVFASNLRAAP